MPPRVPRFERQILGAVRELVAERAAAGDPIDDESLEKLVGDALNTASAVLSERVLENLQERLPDLTVKLGQDRAGFEQRLLRSWGSALSALDGLCNAAIEAGGMYSEDERRRPTWSQADEALVRLHARAVLVGSEIATLLRAGFPSGALARWRTLHELVVTAFFLSEHPELAEAYLARLALEEARRLRKLAPAAARLQQRGPSDHELRQADRAVAALVDRFGRAWDLGDYGWAAPAFGGQRVTLATLEAAVGLDHVRPYVHDASAPIHSGPGGMFEDIGAVASRGSALLAGASNTGLGLPGQMTANSLGQITIALLTFKENLDRLLLAAALMRYADHVADRFVVCEADVEDRVRRQWGHLARRQAFARRRAAAGHAQRRAVRAIHARKP